MSFSTEWDERYRDDTHMSVWPWSDLVSYVMRYARPDRADYKVLELGCGAGANVPFFDRLGVEYFGIDGSEFIVSKLREQWPRWRDRIVAGDFTNGIPFAERFDLVVDRAAVSHNSTEAIRRCLSLVREALKPDGRFVGITWFSTACSDYARGKPADDPYTRTGYEEGPFAQVGKVHFSDRAHLEDLFGGFRLRVLEHRIRSREIPADGYTFASWNLVADPVSG